MNEDRRRPAVTIEDLLRWKRIEQPSAQFWTQFERELRVKQLAAMVEKRPWWFAFPRACAVVRRQRRPLAVVAAAAAVTVGLGFYGYRAARSGDAVPVGDTLAYAPAVARPVAASASNRAPASTRPVVVATVASARADRQVAVAQDSSGDMRSLAVIPAVDDVPQGEVAMRFDSSSLNRPLVVDLAEAQSTGPDLTRNLAGLARGLGARLVSVGIPATEPLAQMPSPAAERRSRLLADALPVVDRSSDLASPADERQLSRLSDDSLYSSSSERRYDVAAERDMIYSNSIKFSIKF